MPRKNRLSLPNSRHHIFLKGVNGNNIFTDNKDRLKLCYLLQEASEKHKFHIHAFCFMRSHLHFVLEPTSSPLHECVHAFTFRYAQYFNRRHSRSGYLFQGRYQSILVDDGMYLKSLVSYVHRAPVEACQCKEPEEYRWSSHRAYLGLDEYSWLTTDFVLAHFSDSLIDAQKHLKEFAKLHHERKGDLNEISKAFTHGIFGSDEFIQRVSPQLVSKPADNPKTIPIEEALAHVCQKFQVDLRALSSPIKNRHLVDARSVLALLGRIGKQQWNLQDVATLLNKNSGSISRLATRANNEPKLLNCAHELLFQ